MRLNKLLKEGHFLKAMSPTVYIINYVVSGDEKVNNNNNKKHNAFP